MIEDENGRVSGSIDRARVSDLLAKTTDEALIAHYQDVLGDSEEGRAATGVSTDASTAATDPAEVEPVEQPRPSMALSKPELVELAQGKVDDPDSKTKAELVEALGGEA